MESVNRGQSNERGSSIQALMSSIQRAWVMSAAYLMSSASCSTSNSSTLTSSALIVCRKHINNATCDIIAFIEV